MKKFIAGVAVGALVFGAVPVFADSIKSLVGTKVTGVYSVEQSGKKIADGAILNGSAYVPVRAIANATGTSLTVEGKKITLESQKTSVNEDDMPSPENLERRNQIIRLKNDLIGMKNELNYKEEGFPNYEKGLKRAQDILNNESEYDPAAPDRLANAQRVYDEASAAIDALKQEIADIEAEIARIQAEIDASK